MAYPDYSIVIVSVTTNGVTTDYSNAFYNEQLAKKYYQKSIAEGKRAFYFEKPTPSKFVRNDDQPLKIDNEKGQENVPIPTSVGSGQEQSLGEVAEEVLNSAQTVIEDAFGLIVVYGKFQIKVATTYWDTFWVGPFKFFKKIFNRVVHEPVGLVVAVDIITNKKVTVKHDGNGGFTYEIEKLYPDKGETLLDDIGNYIIQIAGESPVTIGIQKLEKTFGGHSAMDYISKIIPQYYPYGTQVLDTPTKTYYSDGNGWVYSITKQDPDNPPPPPPTCPNAGQTIYETMLSEITVGTWTDEGMTLRYLITGGEYNVVRLGYDCNEFGNIENRYTANGVVLYSDVQNNYVADGSGGVRTEAKPPEPPEPPSPPPTDCPQEGSPTRKDEISKPDNTRTWEGFGYSGTYKASTTYQEYLADGYCGETMGEETTEYTDAGTLITEITPSGSDWTYSVYVGPSGSYYTESRLNWVDEYDGEPDITDPEVPDTGSFDFPSTEPCSPRASYPYGSISDFKLAGGLPVTMGPARERWVPVTLPQGAVFNTVNRKSSMMVCTGKQWFGRQLNDGQCGYYAEPQNTIGTWSYPEGTAKRAGYFQTQQNIVDNYEWPINWDKGSKNGVTIWGRGRATIIHDGTGGVTVNAWETQ